MAPLCSHLHAGDTGAGALWGSLWSSVSEKATVAPPHTPLLNHHPAPPTSTDRNADIPSSSTPPQKKKESFHRIFCLSAQTVVYSAPGSHKTSNSQTISHPLLSLPLPRHKSNGSQGGAWTARRSDQKPKNLCRNGIFPSSSSFLKKNELEKEKEPRRCVREASG